MSRTSKDYRYQKAKKEIVPRLDGHVPLTSDGAEARAEFEEAQRGFMDGQRRERRHSAAHRKSAMKTHHRMTRANKHSENNKVMREIRREIY